MPKQKDSLILKKVVPYAFQKEEQKQQEGKNLRNAEMLVVKGQEGRERFVISYDTVLTTIFFVTVMLLLFFKDTFHLKKTHENYFNIDVKKMGFFQVRRMTVVHYFLAFLVVSSFFYLMSQLYFGVSGFVSFGYICLFFLFFLFGKILMIVVAGYFFENSKAGLIYLEANLSSYKLAGVSLLPLLFFTIIFPGTLNSVVASLGIIILMLAFFIQIIFSVKILLLYKFSWFHTILYLCTLEIVPLVYTTIAISEWSR